MLPKELVCQYTQLFHKNGWMPGGSGSMAIITDALGLNRSIFVTPQKFSKETLKPGDLFEFRLSSDGQLIIPPIKSQEDDPHVIADLTPLFLSIFIRDSKVHCVVEIASLWAALATRQALRAWQKQAETFPDQLRVSHWGLLQHLGIQQELIIPIIENSSIEDKRLQLLNILSQKPETRFVLIRDYGLLAWGESAEQVKNKVECIEQLCHLQMYQF